MGRGVADRPPVLCPALTALGPMSSGLMRSHHYPHAMDLIMRLGRVEPWAEVMQPLKGVEIPKPPYLPRHRAVSLTRPR